MPKELPISTMQRAALREALANGQSQPSTQLSLSFGERIDLDRLQKAWELTVRRHPILRSTFHHASRGSQTLFENETLDNPWALPDWSEVEPAELSVQWKELLERDAHEGFSRESLPLWRMTLLRLPGGSYHLLWTFHPALLDEESVFLILRDWLSLYDVLAQAETPEIDPTASYGALAESLEAPALAEPDFWTHEFADFPTANPFLTLEHAVPEGTSGRETKRLDVSPDVSSELLSLADEWNVSPDIVLAAAWGMLLGRCGADGDMAIGIVRDTRDLLPEGTGPIAGLFTSRLPLRVREGSSPRLLRDWLQEIAMASRRLLPIFTADSEAFAKLPAPLWQTDVRWQSTNLNGRIHTVMPRWLGLDAQLSESQFLPMSLRATGTRRLEIILSYDSARISPRDADERLQQFSRLLETLALQPKATPEAILPLPLPEAPKAPIPFGPNLISHLIRPDLADGGEQPALQQGEDSISFQDLEVFSNQFAHYLRRERKGDSPIAVCMTATPWIGVAILGALKEGAHLILVNPDADPASLPERLGTLGAKNCVTDSLTHPHFAETEIQSTPLDQVWDDVAQQPHSRPTLKIPANPRVWIVPADPTAPSEFSLEAFARDIESAGQIYQLEPQDRVLGLQPTGTLAGLEEMLTAINHQATLVLADDSALATRTSFQEALESGRITHLRLARTRWSEWLHVLQELQKNLPPSLRRVLVEAGHGSGPAARVWAEMRGDLIALTQFHSPLGLVGTAFVTEATPALFQPNRGLLIGALAAPGRQAGIVDRHGRPVPPGCAGELIFSQLAGDSTESESLNLGTPPVSFRKIGCRAYQDRAGQFHLLLPPGTVKSDRLTWNQLALLQSELAEHPIIYDVRVDYLTPEADAPSAWVVLRDSQASLPEAISEFLEGRVPSALIPRQWASVLRFPLRPDGAIDLAALPTPTPIQRRKSPKAPATVAPTFSSGRKTTGPKPDKTPLLAEIQMIRATGNGTPVVLLFEDEPRKEMLEALDSVLPPDLPIAMLCLPAGKVQNEPHERLVNSATVAIKSFSPKGICHVVSGGNMAVHAIQVASRIQRPNPHGKALVLVSPTLPPLHHIAGLELLNQFKSGLLKATQLFGKRVETGNSRKADFGGSLRYEGPVHLITNEEEPKPAWKVLLPNAAYHSMPEFSDAELASYIATIVTKIENEPN